MKGGVLKARMCGQVFSRFWVSLKGKNCLLLAVAGVLELIPERAVVRNGLGGRAAF